MICCHCATSEDGAYHFYKPRYSLVCHRCTVELDLPWADMADAMPPKVLRDIREGVKKLVRPEYGG